MSLSRSKTREIHFSGILSACLIFGVGILLVTLFYNSLFLPMKEFSNAQNEKSATGGITGAQVVNTGILGTNSSEGQESVIPGAPGWFNVLPTNLRNFLELLYLWIFVYRRPSNLTHMLEGIINAPPETDNVHRVLTVGFNPAESGTSYADTYFRNEMGGSASDLEKRVWDDTKAAFDRVTGGTYTFEIVKSINITDPYTFPDGFSYTLSSYSQCVWGNPNFNPASCEPRKYQFNYVDWIKKYNICETAESVNADEIWMLSLPYIMTWENFMIGPTQGFNVNGQSFLVDTCHKHYIVVNGTYDRSTNLLHNIGHRVEATMNYLSTNWKQPDKKNYWTNFASTGQYSGENPNSPTCGNAHFPFNTSQAYDYSNRSVKENNCNDWSNFPNFTGVKESSGCEKWQCTDPGWQEFWLSRIPKNDGETTMVSNSGKEFTFPNNWWGLLLSPDASIAKKQETN